MFNGYTESEEKIAARLARILKDYQPDPAPAQDGAEDPTPNPQTTE